jgi:hypothetical protein
MKQDLPSSGDQRDGPGICPLLLAIEDRLPRILESAATVLS